MQILSPNVEQVKTVTQLKNIKSHYSHDQKAHINILKEIYKSLTQIWPEFLFLPPARNFSRQQKE